MSTILKDMGAKFQEGVQFIHDKSQELETKSSEHFNQDVESHNASHKEGMENLAQSHTDMMDNYVALKTEDQEGWAADVAKLKTEVIENDFTSITEGVAELNEKIVAVQVAIKEFDKFANDTNQERRDLVGTSEDYIGAVQGEGLEVEAKAAPGEAGEAAAVEGGE